MEYQQGGASLAQLTAGLLKVGAQVRGIGEDAVVEDVRPNRTARRLMDGVVLVPPDFD